MKITNKYKNSIVEIIEEDDDIVNEAEDTLTILSKYISTMPDQVPKNKLDNLVRSLYNEALTIE